MLSHARSGDEVPFSSLTLGNRVDVEDEEAEDSAAEFTGVFPVDWVGRIGSDVSPFFLAAMMLDCLRLMDSLIRTVFLISSLMDSVAIGDTIWRMASFLAEPLASFKEGGRGRGSGMILTKGGKQRILWLVLRNGENRPPTPCVSEWLLCRNETGENGETAQGMQ